MSQAYVPRKLLVGAASRIACHRKWESTPCAIARLTQPSVRASFHNIHLPEPCSLERSLQPPSAKQRSLTMHGAPPLPAAP